MKITKRQLRRIIKEEASQLNELGTGNPALAEEERALTAALANWIDKYRLVMGVGRDVVGDRRIRRILDDMIGELIQ